jgi:hypothetical protein
LKKSKTVILINTFVFGLLAASVILTALAPSVAFGGAPPRAGGKEVNPPRAPEACTANLESTNPTTDETVESFIAILKRATQIDVLTPNQIQKWWNGVWNTKRMTNPFLGGNDVTRFQDAFDLLIRSSDIKVADFRQKTEEFLQTLSSQIRNENHAKQDTHGVFAPHVAHSIPFSSLGNTYVAFYKNSKGKPMAAYIDIKKNALVTVDLTTRQTIKNSLQLDAKVIKTYRPFRDAQGRLWLTAATKPEDPKEGGPKLHLISPGDHRNRIDIDIPAEVVGHLVPEVFRDYDVRTQDGSNFLIGIDPFARSYIALTRSQIYLADLNSSDPAFVPINFGREHYLDTLRVTPSGNLVGVTARLGYGTINQVRLHSAVPWHEYGQYEYSREFGVLSEDVMDTPENLGQLHVLSNDQYVIEFRGDSHVRFFKADLGGLHVKPIGAPVLFPPDLKTGRYISNSFLIDGQTKIVVLTDKGTARVVNLSDPSEIVEIQNVPPDFGFEVGWSPIKKNGRWHIRLGRYSYSNGNIMTEFLLLDLSGNGVLGPYVASHPEVDGHDDDRKTFTLDDGRRVFPRSAATDFVLADVTKSPSSLYLITGLEFGKIGLRLPNLERDGFLNIGNTLVVADDNGLHFIDMFRGGGR